MAIMNLRRTRAVALKESLHILRDPYSLAMAFLTPAMLLFVFGYAITFDVNNINTVVADMDNSRTSRDLVGLFTESGYFTVVGYAGDMREVDGWLDRGRARVALGIPAGFEQRLGSGGKSEVQVLVDGADSNTATIAEGYVGAISKRFAERLRGRKLEPPIEIRSRVWYNSELRSTNFIVPGLIALIMSVIVAVLASLCMAREWERGTMEQLISTPVKPVELVLGKMAPYCAIGLLDLVLSVIIGTGLFDVPLRGSLALLFLVSGVFLFGGVCFGVLISIVARGSQLVAFQMAMLSTFLPALLLSGFMFNIGNLPRLLQFVTYGVQARYYVSVLKGIFLKGSGLSLILTEVLMLLAYAALVFIAANRKFVKRLD